MIKVKEDMTDWRMWEHGISDSRLIIKRQVEDKILPNGNHLAMWECKYNCDERNIVIASGRNIRSGHTLSCGCIKRERTHESKFKISDGRLSISVIINNL